MNNESSLAVGLAKAMLRGFSWGLGTKHLDTHIQDPAELPEIEKSIPRETEKALLTIFSSGDSGLEMLKNIDSFVDAHDQLEDLREYLVDLCVLNIISVGGEDFLESPEWEKIEEETDSRGTEMLNLLVYLRECQLSKTSPELEDYLNEFLLVDDDEFQDEFFIYEEVIRNQILLEGSLKQVIQVGNAQRGEVMTELFTPLMLFFREIEMQPGMIVLKILEDSRLPELHASIYWTLCSFWCHSS